MIEYRNILTSITDVLAANTGGTLDASLTTAVRLISRGDPNNKPVQIDQYPAIFVQLISKDEDFAQIGQQKKDMTINFDIFGLVQFSDGSDDSDLEVQNLARNIESILRTNIRLSQTVLWCNPNSTQFDAAWKDGIWLSAVTVGLECRLLQT